jgi:predicted dithiol-disulfide oxidoreductase (DUF899 family)
MTSPKIGTQQEWLEARKALLAKEKEHTRQKDEITKQRQALPWVKVTKDYALTSSKGTKSLADLFGSNSQLITYHFMFGPDWEQPCKSCSFWADSYNGLTPHLAAQDIAFVAVSSAPIDRLLPFKERMGWDFEWVSSSGTDFNFDYDVGFGPDRPENLSKSYNFGAMQNPHLDEMHGTSVFAKDDDGTVYHTYSMYGRGLDVTNASYAYIDLPPNGRRAEPTEGNPMGWLQYRDAY